MANGTLTFSGTSSIIFVGNSFTFGRVDPVMHYNTAEVRDLTAPSRGGTFSNTTGSNVYEPHPWGGVPGVFKDFADQAGLSLDVALSTRNAASLQGHYLNSNPAGWDLRGNVASQKWDTVVLQDNSTQALPSGAGSITFAAGSSTATLTLDPTGDTQVETDETVGIRLTTSGSYTVGTSGLVSGTILNDDPTGPTVNPSLPTVTLVASPSAGLEDGSGKLVYTFTRTGSTTSALTINFAAVRDGATSPSVATSGGNQDFEAVGGSIYDFRSGSATTTGSVSFTTNTGSITIAPGQTSATITLDPKADAAGESDESIRLTLSSNANYNVGTVSAVQVTILNDDYATAPTTPIITVGTPNGSVFENGTDNLVWQFSRTGDTSQALTVNFGVEGTATLPGSDFTVAGANSFVTGGAESPNLASFQLYAVKLAQYATTGAADGAIPANANANGAANVYLYETWARPNLVVGARVATTDDTTGAVTTSSTSAPEYYASLEGMTADLRAAYEGLGAANPIFKGVAPVGAAFLAAVQNGTATRNPYASDAATDGKVDLWWDDNLHASKYGSYLSGLTLFGTLTGLDPRSLGAGESVAFNLGITTAEAKALQGVAAATLGFSGQANWTAPGQVTELTGTATGTLASAGAFTFADSDTAATHTVSVSALTPGALGAMTVTLRTDTTGDGTGGQVNWSYTVDNAAVEFLDGGETRVERFLVTLTDSSGGTSTREVGVTINGATDPDATYTTPGVSGTGWWGDATVTSTTVTSPTSAVVQHGDGTRTLYIGSDLAVSGGVYSGTITGAAHQDAAGTVTYEQVTNVSASAAAVLGAGSPESNALAILLAGKDSLVGSAGDDVLVGFAGLDTLDGGAGADTMIGGDGADTYVVDQSGDSVVELPGGGTDTVRSTVSTSLGANVENLTLIGTADLFASGNAQANWMIGNDGNNILDGLGGADTMQGGAGNDLYVVDAFGDAVVEFANFGTDTVNSFVSLSLGPNIENLTLLGSGNLVAGGNDLANVLIGNTGDNTLDGRGGADTMRGGLGDDTYVVESAGDVVVELSGEGVDTVNSYISYTLTAHVENLSLMGSSDLSATGNALGNVLIGNAGANRLDGGAGIDLMIGGAGDDVYVVDTVGDTAVEDANGGTDTVEASLSWSLADNNVENLTLTGTGTFVAGGNGLDNVLTGNTGNNTLDGRGGADTMRGGLGNDTYVVESASDVVVELSGEGVDTVNSYISYALGANVENLSLMGSADLSATGNALGNFLIGNGGANVLDGGGGVDILFGGAGNDTFVFRRGQANGDTILDFAGNGAAAGDAFQFVGYGTAVQGANLTQLDGTRWSINSADGLVQDIITLSNGASIHPTDYVFV